MLDGVETLSHAVDRLTAAGYRDDFHADAVGLHATIAGCSHEPEAFLVDEVFRYEGPTDPADESIVFALRCKPHGAKGTYTVAFGPNMPAADARAVRRLDDARNRH
jgi:hypothetical protein